MKILHICNDFSSSKVHTNLYTSLDTLGIGQVVYNPVRDGTPVGNNSIKFKTGNSEIIYSKKLKKHHRFFFKNKVSYLYNDLISKVALKEVQVVHATTLFSDGGVALRIKRAHGIPFIVAVRSTDIKIFLKYRPDLLSTALEIVKEASYIIFISNALKQNFLEHFLIKRHAPTFLNKCVIIYNGIDAFWLDNREVRKTGDPTKILFVGRFINRKKARNIALSVLALNKKGITCEVNFVGQGGAEEAAIKELALQHKGIVNYMGAIGNEILLKETYRNSHIFAMPSKGETFGLVYLEALSQGLPVLYSPNDGIDGVFDFAVGEKCNGDAIVEISEALEKMMKNYNSYELHKIDFSMFRWDTIAQTYLNIFSEMTKERGHTDWVQN